jgi:hypothetical protein
VNITSFLNIGQALEACDLSDPELPPSRCPISQRLLRYLISCALRAVFPLPRISGRKFQKLGLARSTLIKAARSASHWLALAESYEKQHRLSRTVAEFDRGRMAGPIARMVQERGGVSNPGVLSRMTVAYQAVLSELRLVDREDGATLLVARRIVDFATQGERDPQRHANPIMTYLALRLMIQLPAAMVMLKANSP